MLPVAKIFHGVMDMLSMIRTIDIKAIETKGLKNHIKFVDLDGGYTTTSKITPDGQVILSVGYCQLLWNICYVALRISENKRFEDSCYELHAPIELLKNVILQTKHPEFEYLFQTFNAEDDMKIIRLGYKCITKAITPNDKKSLEKVDMNNKFSQTVNGVCIGGITFLLLHELFHWERDHYIRPIKRIEKENEADEYAFQTILDNYDGRLKNTAVIGALCALCSFFFLNTNFNYTGRYPYEDERLFSQFDKVSEKETYALIVEQIAKKWLLLFHPICQGRLSNDSDTYCRLNSIKNILLTIGR